MPPPVPVRPASRPMPAPLTIAAANGGRGGNSSAGRPAVAPKRNAAKTSTRPTSGR
jgi:hypothetical protein